MTFRLSTLGAAAVLALTLSSCGGNPDPIWQQAFGLQCGDGTSNTGNVCMRGSPAAGAPARVSRYCYNTLGQVNCFDRPDPDRNNEPLGSAE